MVRFLITIAFAVLYGVAYSHGNLIKGTVADSLSGAPIVGAYVVLGNVQSTVTDAFGNFRFDGVSDGTYLVRCTHIGFASTEFTVSVKGNETKVVKIKLVESSLNLDEVVVRASNSQENLTSINRIDISLRPLKSSQDVLRIIPGLITAQHAGGGKAEQIFLRGFDIDHGTDITLSVDGIPVNMVSHAHGQGYADLHFVIPEIIGTVDFNKGPYYSAVGDFNTAGFASFQTVNSIDQNSIKLEGGRFDTFRAVGLFNVLNKPDQGHYAYIATEYLYTNGPFISPQYFNRINLFGKYAGRIDDNTFLTASVSTFTSEWDASGQIPERAVSRGLISRFGSLDDTEGGTTGRTNVNFSLLTLNNDGSSIRNRVYFSRYDFELYSNFTFFLNDPVNGDQIKQKESRNIFGYTGSYQRDFNAGGRPLQTEFGIGLRYDDIDDNELSRVKVRQTFIDAVVLGDVDQISANAYADIKYHVSPKLVINPGIRFDAFSFQYVDKISGDYQRRVETARVASPKLSLIYNSAPDLQFYLKTGFGFHSNDTRVVVEREARDILPRAFSADIGVFAKPMRNLLLNFAAWQLNLDQEFVYVGDEAVVEAGGETQRYGIDLSVRYQLLPWLFVDFDGNYAYGKTIGEPEGANYIPLAPRFTSIGGLTSNWRNGVTASLRYRWVGDRPANEDDSVTARGYFLIDAVLAYKRRNVEFSLNASNLLNREWNEAQFDTETFIPGDVESISELTFTPGDPLFIKAGVQFFF